MNPSDPPLPPATFFILFSLLSGDKHGYAIMKDSRELSGNRFRMGPATLYTTIQRLLDFEWITEVKDQTSDDRRRRYYSLTATGRSAIEQELKQMEAIVRKSKAMRLRPAESAS